MSMITKPKSAFTPTGIKHIVKSKKGFGYIVKGEVTELGECVLIDMNHLPHFLLTIEGAKSLSEALHSVLQKESEDPAQTKLSLGQ